MMNEKDIAPMFFDIEIWDNQQLRESLARGLAQSAAGQTADLGDFAQFVDDNDDLSAITQMMDGN